MPGLSPGSLDMLSAVYGLAALFTLVELVRRWRDLVARRLQRNDYALSMRVGFLLLTPFGVLAHEAAHYLVAQAFGARALSFNFRVYWGFVSYRATLAPEQDYLVALVGPATSVALGLLALVVAMRVGHPWRLMLQTFATTTLMMALVLYPALSLAMQFGDFLAIYSNRTPALSSLTVGGHIVAGTVSVLLYRRLRRQDEREAQERQAALAAALAAQSAAANEPPAPTEGA